MIDLELSDDGRPQRAVIRFRGWAARNGLFWGDDGLLYRNATQGRLRLRRHAGRWDFEPDGSEPDQAEGAKLCREFLATADAICLELVKLQSEIQNQHIDAANATLLVAYNGAQALHHCGVRLHMLGDRITDDVMTAFDAVYAIVARLINEKTGNIYDVASATAHAKTVL